MKITKNENYLKYASGMFPVLKLKFGSPGLVNTTTIAKDIANEYYKPRDYELLKYLYFFRFLTFEQILKLLKVEGEDDETYLRNRLNQLISRRIINCFHLADKEEEITDDLQVIYCLDFSGTELISRRYSGNNVINFDVSKNIKDSEMVGKHLFVADFYIRLIDAIGKENILSFDACPDFPLVKNYGGENGRAISVHYCPAFTFSVKNADGEVKNYVCDVFGDEFLKTSLAETLGWANQFLPKTKAYMLNSGEDNKKNIPTYLIFVPNTDDILTAAQAMLAYTDSIKTYRLASEESIKANAKLGDAGVFFRFDEGENVVKAVAMTSFKRD